MHQDLPREGPFPPTYPKFPLWKGQGAATTIRILGKGKVTLEVLVVPRGLCWVLWPSQGTWLAETGMGFLFGPGTEPFVSGCKHELKGFFG